MRRLQAGALAARSRSVELRSPRKAGELGVDSPSVASMAEPVTFCERDISDRSERSRLSNFRGRVDNSARHLSSVQIATTTPTPEEAITQHIIATPATPHDGRVGTPKTRLVPKHAARKARGGPTPHSNTIRLGRRVKARDVHPGDVMQQYDWSLHVRDVEVSRDGVTIAVTEFGFALHYAADEQVRLAA
jgi:hypothetical protein